MSRARMIVAGISFVIAIGIIDWAKTASTRRKVDLVETPGRYAGDVPGGAAVVDDWG